MEEFSGSDLKKVSRLLLTVSRSILMLSVGVSKDLEMGEFSGSDLKMYVVVAADEYMHGSC